MPPPFRPDRRRFLGQASCSAVSALPVLNTLLNLSAAGRVAAAEPGPGEYRALVCLFLNGGCDSFNLLVPRDTVGHAEYAATRSDLALPRADLLPITPLAAPPGREFGLHPGVPELQQLFEAGNCAFVANVGTLVEPVTKAEYLAGSKALPLGLFSHSDQIEQWQTSLPHARSGIGWGGRMADLLRDLNAERRVSMNISLSGSNVWQAGNEVVQYAIRDDEGAVELAGYETDYAFTWGTEQLRSAAVDGQMAQTYRNLLQQTFADTKRSSVEAYRLFRDATAAPPPLAGDFGETVPGRGLRMVARTIQGRAALGATRQTFFVGMGGWDHHDEVLNNQGAMLPQVSRAVGAFHASLVQMGVADQVTLFLASDFGRTLNSNGRGSDHAWGGNMFVVGGGVKGRRIYGTFPSLANGSPLDVGSGRLIPTTSVDAYFAELALWLGVSRASLPLVLPNLPRFLTLGPTDWPVGFLA
jgi:uncharacterized protein (DUF1501 family)